MITLEKIVKFLDAKMRVGIACHGAMGGNRMRRGQNREKHG